MSRELFIHEIFLSFQGEGVLVGVPQVFVRLSGCNLRCSYCDTPAAWERAEKCMLFPWDGQPDEVRNPLETAGAFDRIASFWHPAMHSVSVTGGEPLLQAAALEELLPLLKRAGMRVYLETNGTLAEELAAVMPWTDWIAMDIKLPSSQGGEDLSGRHRAFLRQAAGAELFLKMVITRESCGAEVEEACRAVGSAAPGRTLVLQPVSPRPGETGMNPRQAWELYLITRQFFADVRVVPQAHRAWGIR
ncbi:MAG: 7-carboxy-7-deazaguanine synthase QueE [Actinomycetota bacterium]